MSISYSGKRFMFALTVLFLALSFIVTSCLLPETRVSAEDLMEGIKASETEGKETDEDFISNYARFSLELFNNTSDASKNSLVSPLSVMLALGMTANGADGLTLEQMEMVLGGDIPLSELNKYLYTYSTGLPSADKSKLKISNSIWFRDDEDRLTVEKDFLQTNADHYGADAYKSPFDDTTLKDINNWVDENTDGLIEKILDQISDDTVMYLINAIVFDAEWEEVYNKENIQTGDFHSADGNVSSVEFLNSEENKYIEGDDFTGFVKAYKGGEYSFAALLPSEGILPEELLSEIDGKEFLEAVTGYEETAVRAALPKFSYEYKVKMNDALKVLGMPDAFESSAADFTRLGKSSRGNIFIGEVLHKTFISVDELGTKAGAVTKVEMQDESYVEMKDVRLDRPFAYAIIDSNGLPLFIGTVMDAGQ